MKINASNNLYDFLNALVRYILPAFGTMYFTLSQIWNLPHAEEVVGTIVAVSVFVGVIIALARQGWKNEEEEVDGDLYVDIREEGSDLLTVGLNNPVEEVRAKEDIRLRVITSSHE